METCHFSTSQKVLRGSVSSQSYGHCILGCWRNCTDWLSWTWQHYYRNLLRWSDWKMPSGTEREETRKVASRCDVSPGQCTCSHIITTRTAIRNVGFELLHHPPYSPDLAPTDFYLFPKLKKFTKGRKFAADEDVIYTASGRLEDQDQEFFYNGIQALQKCWIKCISVGGNYVEKWQNNMCIFCC